MKSFAVLITCSLSTVLSTSTFAATPFLRTLAETPGGVAIAVGTSSQSQNAAQIIRNAIRAIPGQEAFDNVKPAADFNASTREVTGGSHVIVVGTFSDNVLVATRNWLPSWFIDRDWYYNQYGWSLSPQTMSLPYQPTTGTLFAGYGQWPSGDLRIGYVEVDRSFLFMEWLVRARMTAAQNANLQNVSTITSPAYPSDVPLRLMVKVTGSGGDGVLEVAKAFANDGLLNGVVLASGAAADSGPRMFTLTAGRYSTKLPFSPPDSVGPYAYQGWLLADAFQYDGFLKTTGIAAQIMYRVKYKPASGITGFWSTPHRRASQFEICAIKLASPSDATTAETALKSAAQKLQSNIDGRLNTFGTAVVGNILYVRSIPGQDGANVLNAFSALPSW